MDNSTTSVALTVWTMSPSTNPLDYAPCRVPLRRATGVFGGINITVHAGCYEDVLEADRRWEANGGNALYDIRQGDTGSYNCRPSAAHSRAVAIDFNWSGNPYGPKRTPCPQEKGMREFYELCWKPLGYGWGANWNSKCDAMHVSKLKSEGGDGVLYRTWGEEDWFAMASKEELREVVQEELEKRLGHPFDPDGKLTVLQILTEKTEDGKFVDGIKLIRQEIAALKNEGSG